MEMRYFVDYKLHNTTSDNWAYKTTKNTTDLAEAKKDYHLQLYLNIGRNLLSLHLNLNRPQIQQMKLLHNNYSQVINRRKEG